MLARSQELFPESDLSSDYCERLIASAATSDLQPERLLSPQGIEVSSLRKKTLAPGACRSMGRTTRSLSRPRTRPDDFDIYRPLRSLGIGAAVPEPAEEMPPRGAGTSSIGEPDPEGGIFRGILSGLAGPTAPELAASTAPPAPPPTRPMQTEAEVPDPDPGIAGVIFGFFGGYPDAPTPPETAAPAAPAPGSRDASCRPRRTKVGASSRTAGRRRANAVPQEAPPASATTFL